MKISATILFLVSFVSLSNGQDTADVQRLIRDKMANYNKAVRPVNNVNTTLDLTIAVYVFALKELDEVFETLSLSSALVLTWRDELLAWDPSEYGGVQEIELPSSDIWLPNVVNVNTAKNLERVSADWLHVQVKSNGRVMYGPGIDVTVLCSLNVYYYPFDKQRCIVEFVTWGYGDNKVNFISWQKSVNFEFYKEGGPWRIADSNLELKAKVVNAELLLVRKSKFLIVNVVCPTVILALLNTFAFLIPTESGERISYCLTVLLAIAVFLTLVNESLPKTSEPLSLFSIYLLITLIQSLFVTLGVIFSLNIYFRRQEDQLPTFLRYAFRCCTVRRAIRRSCGNTVTLNDVPGYQAGDLSGKRNGRVQKAIYVTETHFARNAKQDSQASKGNVVLGMKENRTIEKEDKHKIDNTDWKGVSKTLDKIFFLFFLILLTVITSVFGFTVCNSEQ